METLLAVFMLRATAASCMHLWRLKLKNQCSSGTNVNVGTVGKRQAVAEEAGSLPRVAYELNDASQVGPAHTAK